MIVLQDLNMEEGEVEEDLEEEEEVDLEVEIYVIIVEAMITCPMIALRKYRTILVIFVIKKVIKVSIVLIKQSLE